MKLRAILSCLLVTLLLGVSSWAEACDLSCELHLAMPACDPATRADAGQTSMASMSDDQCHGMMMRPAAEGVSLRACAPMTCGHQVQLAAQVPVDSFKFLWSASQPSASTALHEVPPTPTYGIVLAVPGGDPPGFNPLLVSLRV